MKPINYTSQRREILAGGLLGSEPTLEFGPLDRPILRKDVFDVSYIDYTDLESLKQIYINEVNVNIESICPPDYVLSGAPLRELTGGRAFHGIVASHVVEHVPNIVGWLEEVSQILKDNGLLNLAIPDKRFTFDLHRQLSTSADMVEAFLLKPQRPSVRSIFDHCAFYIEQDTYSIWRHGPRPIVNSSERLKYALKQAQQCLSSEQYLNSHCWVFTPDSFLLCFLSLVELELTNFTIESFHETALGRGEFFVSLMKLPESLGRDKIKGLQRAGLRRVGCDLEALDKPLNVDKKLAKHVKLLYLFTTVFRKFFKRD